jgi:hypothetical protein
MPARRNWLLCMVLLGLPGAQAQTVKVVADAAGRSGVPVKRVLPGQTSEPRITILPAHQAAARPGFA